MGRKASKLVLMSAGAALAWFLDPVSGSDRRRQVADRLSGLTGGAPPGSDPTGGAVPPAVATVQPTPQPILQPPAVGDAGLRADFDLPSEPDVAQAVEAAAGGEKLLGFPDGPVVPGGSDPSRATLRATP